MSDKFRMGLFQVITLAFIFSIPVVSWAEDSCLKLYEKQSQQNREDYHKLRDRHVHGEVTLSGNGQVVMLPNANITFAGEQEYYEYRNDEQIALELLNSEFILKITDGEAYEMLLHLQNKLEKDDIKMTIAQIQEYIKKGFEDADSKFCKNGKTKKIAGQIIRYAKRKIQDDVEDQKYNNSPRKLAPAKQKLADDFNTERDIAGKKKPVGSKED